VRRGLARLLALHLIFVGAIQGAHGAMIGTQPAISAGDRMDAIDRIEAGLAREAVRDELTALGVDPDEALARIQALSDEEIRALEGRLDALPAGEGVLEVVGIVFLVLLILELVGVTHIFSAI
jgi:hypothetical protein